MSAIAELAVGQVNDLNAAAPGKAALGSLMETVIEAVNSAQTDLDTAEATLAALGVILAALTGLTVLVGNAAFTTTGVSKAVDIGALTAIDFAVAMPRATFAADERLWIGSALSSGDALVERAAASPTSALSFWYLIIGH